MNRASSGDWGIPLVLIPVIGGLGGMFFAALLAM